MVDDVAGLLAALGFGTAGTDLFTRHAPPEPDELLCVIQLDGEDPEFVQNSHKIELERPLLQVWARSGHPATAESMIDGPYRELSAIRNQTIGGTRYVYITPLHAPAVYERDDNGRFVARCDFRVRKELNSGT